MSQVRRIDAAINFGSYCSFTWDTTTEDFKRYNLLYGWNYSGKTTLSRMFAFLQRSVLPDGITGHFQATIEDHQGNTTTLDSRTRQTSLPVRVFNRDFVSANFEQEHNAPAIHILGENVKHLRDIIVKRRKQIERQNCSISTLIAEQSQTKIVVDHRKTDFARIGGYSGTSW